MRTLPRALPLLALLAPGLATAVDLDDTVLVWSLAYDGLGVTTGNDEAHGIAIDSFDTYIVAGWRDGMADEQDSAYVMKVDSNGEVIWDLTLESGPVDGVDKLTSTDRFYDMALDREDRIDLVGTWNDVDPEDKGDVLRVPHWRVWQYDEDLGNGDPLWNHFFHDGDASMNQEALAIDIDENNDLVVGGWAHRNDAGAKGRWITHTYFSATGEVDQGPIGENWGAEDFAMEQIHGIAVDSEGNIIVAGTRGVDGAAGADDANLNWHVIKYDPDFGVLWRDTYEGDADLLDVPMGVAVNNDDEIVVAGYTNVGTDNGAGADWDWLAIMYPPDGPDDPDGPRLWEYHWTTKGVSERALAVHIDEDDNNIMVGGEYDDGGILAGRVVHLADSDGDELSEWKAPAGAGHGAVTALNSDRRRVAIAGYVGNGTDNDMWTTILETDRDGDGVPDSLDGCPDDAEKTEPMICGCNVSEADTDGDKTVDCEDVCPDDPEKWDDRGECGCGDPETDSDGDGTQDCIDNCPYDPNKVSLGICGCGAPDDDSDGDGVLGCDDACSNTPPGTPVDDHGCPEEATGTGDGSGTGTGTGGGKKKNCGCQSTGSPAGGALLLALGALALRRRRLG